MLHTFQPQAIQAIKNSELVDINLPRSGLIILSHCQFLQKVILMIKKKLPVYFFWGIHGITERYDYRFKFKLYSPTPRNINAAFSLYNSVHAPHEPKAALPPPSEERKPFPKHPQGSLQILYESPWEYLNRRAHIIAECYRHVDSVEKEAFKQWAAAQLTFPRPGMQGPPPFLWDTGEDDNGYLIRCPY